MIVGHLKPHIEYDTFDGQWVCYASLVCRLVASEKYYMARDFVKYLNLK